VSQSTLAAGNRMTAVSLRNLAMIKAIIFDLGRVIVPFDFSRGYAQLAELGGIPAGDVPKRIGQTDLVQRFECGKIAPGDFVRDLADHLNIEVDHGRFCDIWNSIFLPETLISDDLLTALKEHHRLVLLSNTNQIHFEGILANYPLLRHFDEFVVSYRVGFMKPAPEIYRAAVRAARCRPDECFFTDDIAEYVEGAKREGLDAVQFQSENQIEEELRRRGVRWGAIR
jgi:putative hydrolase of the HAD superfamily